MLTKVKEAVPPEQVRCDFQFAVGRNDVETAPKQFEELTAFFNDGSTASGREIFIRPLSKTRCEVEFRCARNPVSSGFVEGRYIGRVGKSVRLAKGLTFSIGPLSDEEAWLVFNKSRDYQR